MAVYIQLTTDAFASTFNAQQSSVTPAGRAGISNARRPLRGLEIKDDTYSIIKVVTSNGTELPLIDSGSVDGNTTQYSNFILQQVTEARMEKHQIVETFGESYIFFFGESPRFLDVTAVLVDSLDFNWYAEFWANYDQYLRGSKSVEMGARTYLFYDDNIVEGYMLMAQATKIADQPLQARLTFRLFLTNYQNISFVGSDTYPIRAGVNIPPDVTATTADAFDDPSVSLASSLSSSVASQATIGVGLAIEQAQDAATQQLIAEQQAASSAFGAVGLTVGALSAGVSVGIGIGGPGGLPFMESVDDAYPDQTSIPRTLPLRSLISDNSDEYTGQTPPAPGADDPSTSEAPDLSMTAIQQAGLYGGDINDPNTFAGLGLGVNFGVGAGVGIGIGIGGGAYTAASFGVSAGVGLNGVYGGINGGLGFIGGSGVGASASLSVNSNPLTVTTQANAAVSVGTAQYGNGVQLSGGIIAGTGVGGGIPGGLSEGIGPTGPGSLTIYTGATAFAAQQATSAGYGANISGSGASINVGGAPSAFAMVVSTGTLSTEPSDDIEFFVGPDGNYTTVNETGYNI